MLLPYRLMARGLICAQWDKTTPAKFARAHMTTCMAHKYRQSSSLSSFRGCSLAYVHKCRKNISADSRGFSTDSSIEKEIEEKLSQLIRDEAVLLLLKGSPDSPRCGFSAALVNILDKYKVSNYAYIDVYSHELLPQCAKRVANWPTFPQLFVNGKFIGGCDIVKELHESGELGKLLGESTREA